MNTNKTNLLIDAGVLIGFLISAAPHLTGNTWHEWIAIGLALVLLVHLALHWDWVKKVAGHYFKKLLHNSRLQFVVDLLIFIGFVLVMLSGIMISESFSRTLGLQIEGGQNWKMVHKLSGEWIVYLVAVHVGLQWKWIINMVRRYLVSPVAGLFAGKTGTAHKAAPGSGLSQYR